jgi:hypothetical protein
MGCGNVCRLVDNARLAGMRLGVGEWGATTFNPVCICGCLLPGLVCGRGFAWRRCVLLVGLLLVAVPLSLFDRLPFVSGEAGPCLRIIFSPVWPGRSAFRSISGSGG